MPNEDNNSKYAATSWGAGSTDLEVPSGQLCKVRKSSVQTLMAAGIIHNMDMLTSMVDEKLITPAEGKRPTKKALDGAKASAQNILADPKKFDDLMTMMDKIVCHIVLEPQILRTPNDQTNRKNGVIYADMVDLEDKLFIFQFAVGGTEDLEQFRKEANAPVGSVDTLTKSSGPA